MTIKSSKILKNYFENTAFVINNLHQHNREIHRIYKEIIKTTKKEGKILVCGNGGSSADADHFVGELICTFVKRNRKPISAVSMSALPSAITAWSNDFDYNTYLKRFIQANGKKNDLLIILSTGGGDIKKKISTNVVKAAQEAKKKGIKIISLVGKTGGILKKISDISIIVKSFETSIIQECHMSILHAICILLDKEL